MAEKSVDDSINELVKDNWQWSPAQHILDWSIPRPRKITRPIRPPPPKMLTNSPAYMLEECAATRLRRFGATVPRYHKLEGDVLKFLRAMQSNSAAVLSAELKRLGSIKMYLSLTAEYQKPGAKEGEIITTLAYHTSRSVPILNDGNIQPALAQATAKMMKDHEEFTRQGSGWTLKRCVKLDLSTAQYRPLRARGFFKTPEYVPP